jgi:hypothetical protein
MLIELYIEALLTDESLADEVWALWNLGLISDDLAIFAWYTLVLYADRMPRSAALDTT